jgi:hypothetical protein
MLQFQKFITCLLASVITTTLFAQNETSRAKAYIETYKELAITEMLRTGVPASITLAQGILETGGGQSELASVANNHFGIKCKSDWTGETMLHDDDARGECFRKYANVESSFADHSDFLKNRPNYAFLFKLDATDYEGWAKGLKKAGYATNPTYAQRLMKIIVDNGLQQITLLALNRKEDREAELFVQHLDKSIPARSADKVNETSVMVNNKVSQGVEPTSKKSSEFVTGQVFTINDLKVLYADAGTSLFALANNHSIAFKKLLDYNELDEVDILPKAQLIFLQKKQKRGDKDIHIVQKDENLYEICQKEGIQLLSLLEYNRLQKGMEPAMGERLYLKSPAPASPKLASNERPFASTSME